MERVVGEHLSPAVLPDQRSGPPDPVPFRHAAAVVDTRAQLLAVALPFLDAGLRAGDLVALTCRPETADRICAELGERSRQVESDRALSLLGARAPDALGRARGFVARAAGQGSGRLRILSEVDFEASSAGWREGLRFESACNRFMRDAAVTTLCLYDRRRLPEPVVDSVAHTHPELVSGSTWAVSPAFQEPRSYVAALPVPREPIEDTEPVLAVDDAPALAGLRHRIGAALTALVPDREQREDLHLATSEVAANAFRHGTRPVSARIWTDGTLVVCTIRDAGRSFGDPLAGFQPAHGDDLSRGGMGLWLARKLWDVVDLLPGPDGFTVRLTTRLR
ncbi:anti-sigma factor RsbA family regulatory protein [Geodermatophilus sp. CPCC 206100]|uniref:anti-sigma factor RsbA family regulatory protein n=1 Tax=Geodermatophilus sp. CPCC 206100 TaxID=3020054 RepID=UPI003AFFD8AC